MSVEKLTKIWNFWNSRKFSTRIQ